MKIIRLHLCYLLSRFNLMAIVIIILLYLSGLIINIVSIPQDITAEVAKEMYFYNVVSILKLVLIILIIFLLSYTGLYNNDRYQLYLLNKREDRIKYYLTKMFALFIVTMSLIIIFMMLFLLCGLLFTSWYKIEFNHLKFFGYLMLISLMYGYWAYNLVKFMNSIIVMFIPCLVIILEEAFISLDIIQYISYLFPILENNANITLSYGMFHVIILICCHILIGLIKTYTADIK